MALFMRVMPFIHTATAAAAATPNPKPLKRESVKIHHIYPNSKQKEGKKSKTSRGIKGKVYGTLRYTSAQTHTLHSSAMRVLFVRSPAVSLCTHVRIRMYTKEETERANVTGDPFLLHSALELHMYGIVFMRKHIAYLLTVSALFHSSNDDDANQGRHDTV